MSVQVPLRITVVGNSMPLAAAPWAHGERQATYPRKLERLLAGRGIASNIENFAKSASLISDAVCAWETTVMARSPDVVIVHYGHLECAPGVIPRRLEKRVNGWHYHGSRTSRATRRGLLKVWPAFRRFQQAMDRHLGLRTSRMPAARFEWELRHFLSMTFGVGQPLVLLMDMQRFGSRFTHWIPHVTERRAVVQEVLERVAADYDQVHLVRVSELIEELGVDVALPDSVHFSPSTHEAVAELVLTALQDRGYVP